MKQKPWKGVRAVLTVYPDYYPSFRCLAGQCRHTCCAGWEIDIDPQTRARYRTVSGTTGRRLAAAIEDRETPARFRLTEEERCPFPNGDNLCDLILSTGDESLLCQICRDHPRFRNFLPERTEIGLGLCCEAAAALILSQTEPVRLVREGMEEASEPEDAVLLSLRDELLRLAQERSLPLEERMEQILSLCGAELPNRPMSAWSAFFLRLERLDERWTDILNDLSQHGDSVDIIRFRHHMSDRMSEYEQLLVYFLYRHILKARDDGDVTGKAAFAVLSTRILFRLGAIHYERHGSFTFSDQVEYARMYSSEIEYSDDNLDALYDARFCPHGDT